MDEKQILLEAWKTTITSQAHFNEMTMKLRSTALTLVAAILTAESLAGSGSLAVVAALISWVAFYVLDRWFYFYLLLGTILLVGALEKRANELGMVLPKEPDSANSLLGLTYRVSKLNQEHWKLLGKYKLDVYYALIAVAIGVILCVRITQAD